MFFITRSIPFGSGPRRCAGAHLARPILSEFINFIVAAEFRDDRAPIAESEAMDWQIFKPAKNHVYSGRTNDDDKKDDAKSMAANKFIVEDLGTDDLFVASRLITALCWSFRAGSRQ
jgi:hypothetical protein